MITGLGKLRYFRIVGFAIGAVVVAGTAVVVTASASGVSFGFKSASSDTTTALSKANSSSSVCSDFMSHFAVDIGKSQAQINSAFQKAISDTLADQVKSGQITQAQADAIKQKIANQTPCTLSASLAHYGGSKAEIGAYMQAYVSAAASALGITDAQMKTDLTNGQSLSQIASAQNVSEGDFRTRLIANLQPTLDAAVAKKQLTSAQEQAIINRLKTGELPLWNRPLPHKPSPTAAPTAA